MYYEATRQDHRKLSEEKIMPGTKNMLLGALWAIGGIVVTAVTYSAASEGGIYVVTWGAIVIGGIQFIVGLVQYLGYQAKGTEGKQKVHAEASVRAILRAMMATAAADGVIEDAEVESIAAIYERVFGASPEKEWIKETSEKMLKENFDIYKAISEEKSIINPDTMPLVFKASYLVAAADGSLDDKESEILMKIANALGMSDAQVQEYITELQNPAGA